MKAVILSIGTELTTGELIDSNSAWIAVALTQLGIPVVGHLTVDDDKERIRIALKQAIRDADIVIATGGLGPTPDDLTREAIAAAIDQPLEDHPDALAQIQALFQKWQRPFDDANRVQALVPHSCRPILNECGTAPGICYESNQVRLYALPGVPAEMKAMLETRVLPDLKNSVSGRASYRAILHSFGVSEARLGTLLGDLMARGRNPSVGTTASHGVIGIRILGFGPDMDVARSDVLADSATVQSRLGTSIFGSAGDTLESVVADLLRSKCLTVATAESCTGGLLSKRLTDISGSSSYFLRGLVTYSNESKCDLLAVDADLIQSHGAVSEPVAAAMASGCRASTESDLAISITGVGGPTGGSPPEKPIGLVFIGLASDQGVEVKRVLLGEHLDRKEIRSRAASVALNLLRLHLLRRDTPSG